MSERAPSWFAIPLHHLTQDQRRAVVARRLGLHHDDLVDQLGQAPIGTDRGGDLLFTREDVTAIETVDGVSCLCWSEVDAANGGEGDAIALRGASIPYLHWWGSSSAFAAGAEVYQGRGEPVWIRTDADLGPIVGIGVRGDRFVVDAVELQEAQDYLRGRRQVLDCPAP